MGFGYLRFILMIFMCFFCNNITKFWCRAVALSLWHFFFGDLTIFRLMRKWNEFFQKSIVLLTPCWWVSILLKVIKIDFRSFFYTIDFLEMFYFFIREVHVFSSSMTYSLLLSLGTEMIHTTEFSFWEKSFGFDLKSFIFKF